MNDKLVERFIAYPHNLRMGCAKLAKRWKVTEEEVREARKKAKLLSRGGIEAEAGNYVAALEYEVTQKVNVEKGTLESTASCDFDPKDDEELAKLHKIDLTKYKIASYWSKLKSNGKFTSSVFCTLRKIDDDAGIQIDTIKKALQLSFLPGTTSPRKRIDLRKGSRKAMVIITSDEHVAAANLEDDLYNIPWDKTEYVSRKFRVLSAIQELRDAYGPFEECFDIKLGDDLDGWNGGTTRSGEPGHAHVLPQNMSNSAAVETYIRVNNWYWDELLKINPALNYAKYDVVNSNHGGKGLDYIANLGVQIYLEAKHPDVRTNYITKFVGHFHYGQHNVMMTHGKDESYRKKPLPLNLDPNTEVFVKQYMDYHSLTPGSHNLLLKGDLHQWNWNSGKFFDYVNVGSLYGSSGWVQANFGLTRPSFVIGWLDYNTSDFLLKPVYL